MILNESKIDDLKKGLTSDSDFVSTYNTRKSVYAKEISVKHKYVDQYLEDGWVKIPKRKTKLTQRMGLPESPEDLFEDRLWCLFANMGYSRLNKTRDWVLPFGKGSEETKQIDVFAVNDETIVFVECKHTDTKKNTSLKTELESYQKIMEGLIRCAKELFPDNERKTKFVLATENYTLSDPDRNRVNNLNGIYLSEENIEYFEKLYENIGSAARYQFAGYLFEGNSIPSLPNKVPAIRASMGGLTYYSFSIEPETLLKMSYVFHKTKANQGQMDSYQRLVKGSRLKSIQKFINDEKGFFPNSIIINVTSGKSLQFDLAGKVDTKTDTKMGILHLPAKYKSVQIIDGQHRLLAYAGSDYASTHTIPVVAFENLNADMQIKLFMQINQNQKPVDKTLRNTLNARIYGDSDILSDRIHGMRLQIAEDLANEPESWLYGCVSSGIDDGKITSNAIDLALNMDVFLGKIKKNETTNPGVFFKGDEKKAYANFKKFIFKCVEYLVSNVSEVQQPGEDGYILTNRGLYGYFRCIGDILSLLREKGEELEKVDDIFDKVCPYLEPLIAFFNTKIKDGDEETIAGLKTSYGGGGDTRYMRTFERVIHEEIVEFCPEGLIEYWEKFSKERVDEAKRIVEELADTMRVDIVDTLKNQFGDKWFDKGISLETKVAINKRLTEYNDQFPDHPTNLESMISFSDMIEIILKNWDLFKTQYADPEVKGGERRPKLKWIDQLSTIKKNLDLNPFIDKANLDFLKRIKEQYNFDE